MTVPNQDQIEYWNITAGPKWVARQETLDAVLAPLGNAALDAARPTPGERVLDIGCGAGTTTLLLAGLVGETGSALGADLSRPLHERARERAAASGLANVEFIVTDAQTHDFEPGAFDLVFSRLGVMFFDDPPAAFANLRRATRAGGRLAFACWDARERNPWMTLPLEAAGRHVELPAPAPPGSPGGVSLADADATRALLAEAGYRNATAERFEYELVVGNAPDLDDAVDYALTIGPASRALGNSDDEVVQRVAVDLREVFAARHVEGVGVRLAASAWLVRGDAL